MAASLPISASRWSTWRWDWLIRTVRLAFSSSRPFSLVKQNNMSSCLQEYHDSREVVTVNGRCIYTALCVMILMRANPLRRSLSLIAPGIEPRTHRTPSDQCSKKILPHQCGREMQCSKLESQNLLEIDRNLLSTKRNAPVHKIFYVPV